MCGAGLSVVKKNVGLSRQQSRAGSVNVWEKAPLEEWSGVTVALGRENPALDLPIANH